MAAAPTFSVRTPPGAFSFVVTHTERLSAVYLTCATRPVPMVSEAKPEPLAQIMLPQGLRHQAMCLQLVPLST